MKYKFEEPVGVSKKFVEVVIHFTQRVNVELRMIASFFRMQGIKSF